VSGSGGIFSEGFRGSDGPIEVIRLSGTPFERGLEHGAAVADRLEYYWGELVADVSERAIERLSKDELRGWIKERSSAAVAIAPDLEQEIRGIAEGAGVEYEVALAVSFGEEVCHLASARGVERGPGAGDSSPLTRCLSVVVPPEKSATGSYLLAQTWDGPDWTPDPILFAVDEEAGRSAYLSDGGWVGGVGLNDRGLGSVHTGVSTVEDGTPGVPYPFIARRIMQAGSFDEAVASVVEVPATAGCHFLVGDGTRLTDVEVAGALNAVVPMTPPVSTCAHFCAGNTVKTELSEEWHRISAYRVERLLSLLADRSDTGPLDVFEIMSDHEEGPSGATVCRHPGTGRSLGAIVVDMGTSTVYAQAGNPCLARPIVSITVPRAGVMGSWPATSTILASTAERTM
jgi:isopenicillin-N N-acyltransferase-like protein